MELLNMMRKSQNDFSTFKNIVQANIAVNETLLDTVAHWFENVEIIYPIAEMLLSGEETIELGGSVAGEMTSVVETAISEIQGGAGDDEVLERASAKLDSLWRELAGVYAPVLNERFKRVAAKADTSEVLAGINHMVDVLVQMSGEEEDVVRVRMRKNAAVRAKLRLMGIDPDSI